MRIKRTGSCHLARIYLAGLGGHAPSATVPDHHTSGPVERSPNSKVCRRNIH